MNADSDARDPVEELAEDFLLRQRRGETPTLEDYVRRHPELADDIRELFPALVMIENLGGSSLAATGAHETAEPGQAKLERIGDYRIVREVGRGGMGVVYEAEQESLGRWVALKVLPAHALLDANHVRRFEREAKAAAKLHHTNIVPVFGVGHDGDTHYYVMQFIRGQGLDDVLEDLRHLRAQASHTDSNEAARAETAAPSPRPLAAADLAESLLTGTFRAGRLTTGEGGPEDEALAASASVNGTSDSSINRLPDHSDLSSVSESGQRYWHGVARIGVQVADALDYAHGQGILHRDIKPSNLLLDMKGTVWVTDFGLAKAGDAEDLTHTGDIIGTIRYMAPERFQGRSDARSEVYALGLTLFELCCLRPAFPEKDRPKLMQQVMNADAPLLRKLNSSVPRDLETIIHKAISREPAQRYGSAAALGDDLKRFLEDRPILARRASLRERSWRWCRRNPLVAALGAAVFLVTCVGFGATISQMSLARWNEQEAIKNEAVANEQRDAAERGQKEARKANASLEEAEKKLRYTLYASQMNLVQSAWDANNVRRVVQVLDAQVPKAGEDDLRGFEWHYWQRLCNSDSRTIKLPIKSEKTGLAGMIISADGTLIAGLSPAEKSGVFDLQVWETGAGKLIRTFPKVALGPEPVLPSFNRGAFSSDGKRLAWVSKRGDGAKAGKGATDLVVWNITDGSQSLAIPLPDALLLEDIAFSPDGRRLASAINHAKDISLFGTGDTTITVWDAHTGKEVFSIIQPGQASGLQFSPDSARLAVPFARRTKQTAIWDAEVIVLDWGGKELQRLKGNAGSFVSAAAFSPDGANLATIQSGTFGEANALHFWDLSAGKLLQSVSIATGHCSSLRYSPDGKSLAAPCGDQTIRVWDTASRKLRLTLKGHVGAAAVMAFNADSSQIVSATTDGVVKFWDATAQNQPTEAKPPAAGFAGKSVISPDGKLFAMGVQQTAAPKKAPAEQGIHLLDALGKELFFFRLQAGHPHGMAFSPDGGQLAAIWHLDDKGEHYELHVWNTKTGKDLYFIPTGGAFGLNDVAFSPDGARLAATFSILGKESQYEFIAGGVKLWDAATGKELHSIQERTSGQWQGVAYSHDGSRLAAVTAPTIPKTDGRDDGAALHVWNAGNMTEVVTRKGLDRGLRTVVFSPDCKLLAAAIWEFNEGGDITVMDAVTGDKCFILQGHSGPILDHAFSPDGRRIVSLASSRKESGEAEIKIWDVAGGLELLSLRCRASFGSTVAFSRDGYRLLHFSPSRRLENPVETWDATPRPDRP